MFISCVEPWRGFSLQPAPSVLDCECDDAWLHILLNLPLASRNIVFAPVTFKVPSRLGPSIWKTFLLWIVSAREVQFLWWHQFWRWLQALGCPNHELWWLLLQSYSPWERWWTGHKLSAIKASFLQTFNLAVILPKCSKLFQLWGLKWEQRKGRFRGWDSAECGGMAGQCSAGDHVSCPTDPDLPRACLARPAWPPVSEINGRFSSLWSKTCLGKSSFSPPLLPHRTDRANTYPHWETPSHPQECGLA